MNLRIAAVLILATCMSACGADNGGAPSLPTAAAPAQPTTVHDAIVAAEKSGALPVLNRDDTLAGPDMDGNGIRDDIDAWISKLPDTDLQKAAVRQEARVIQRALLVNVSNTSDVARVSADMMSAVNCLHRQFTSALESNRSSSIEKYTVNTKGRFLAYGKFNASVSGSVVELPSGDTCENATPAGFEAT